MKPVKPVLVTGSPRSGTTWVGRMLSASPQLYYIHEPFNPDFPPGRGICDVRFRRYQTYITEADEGPYLKPVRRMIEGRYNLPAALLESRSMADLTRAWGQKKAFDGYRRRGVRPLIKDPIALMSAGWLARRFDIHVLVMIRHPAAFVASMKRLAWGFDPARWALSQPSLLRDYLAPLEGALKRLDPATADVIDQAALLWKTAYFVVSQYQREHPEWVFLRHEDLARDPVAGYTGLFGRLGLAFTDAVRARIVDHSHASNPSHARGTDMPIKLDSRNVISHWKKALSNQEVMRIRAIVQDVSSAYYSADEWEMDNSSIESASRSE